MNYVDKDVPYTRIIEHKHFLFGDEKPFSVITKEYPAIYRKGENEPYYPIEDEKNREVYGKYKQLAIRKGIVLCGRLAEYKYYDMQDAIKSALSTARSLIAGR